MTVCQEFRTVFGNTLTRNAATLKPFELNVDLAKWETPANRSVPRHMCPKKQFEIQRQVTELLAAGIIEHSTASYYSQVILVPKPGQNQWRLCVDYRNMNNCTEPALWPIPSVDQMLRRLGQKSARFFGTMDLTQGYHQAPASRIFTAFIIFSGMYQFTRVPFGPKRAPSYFQEQMAS